MDIDKMIAAAKTTPYADRPGQMPVTPAAWAALARAKAAGRGYVMLGGERCSFVARASDGLLVLAIGEDDPGGPTDPDLTAK